MTGRKGRLSWEARAEEVSFQVLPKDAMEGLFLTWRGKEFQRAGAVTEGIRKVFN